MSRVTRLQGRTLFFAILLAWTSFGQTASNAQTFALTDTKDLVLLNVKADALEYQGRKAVRLTKDTEKDGFALLRGTDFQDGVIEADIALNFSNVRITNSTPSPVKNGADASGTWEVRFLSDAGVFNGTLQLKRDGSKVTGTWSGALGDARAATGTWRVGYLELSFNAEWPSGHLGDPGSVTANLAGWIDGDSAGGRMRVEGRADGRWTATRKP